ncbi:50S ribosomal protein L21 [Synechococcus sp. M16CYN]|uniref:50S ribosomal protein L21 n=1 Tax=Synechococcus sp. M16CYN TaxID=3103139 RepID=UPI0032561FD2
MTDTKLVAQAAPMINGGAYAIVEASGTQLWLQADRYYDLDRLQADVNETVELGKVLLIKDSKKGTTLGRPYVEGASVIVRIMAHRRGPKTVVYKMRPKKKTRRKNGHRQELTRVMVQSIMLDDQSIG